MFDHLLEYQDTPEFQQEAQDHRECILGTRRLHNRTYSANYRRDHPELVKMREQAERYKPFLYTRQDGLCYLCNAELGSSFEIDHVIPLIRGGTNKLSNLRACCRHCNRVKKDKIIRTTLRKG